MRLMLAVLAMVVLLAPAVSAAQYLRVRPCAQLPGPVADAAVVACAGKVWCIGGRGPTGPSKDVWSFDPVTLRWTREISLEEARFGHAAVAIGSRVFVIGGMRVDGTTIEWANLVEELDARRGRWRVVGTAPSGRARFGAVAVGTSIMLIGGRTPSEARTAKVDILEPSTMTWSRGVELPEPRSGLAAVMVGSDLYVLGGESAEGAALNTVLRYTTGTHGWLYAPSMKSPRRSPGAVRMGGTIMVLGGSDGYTEQRGFLSDIEVFDPKSAVWDTAGLLREPRDGAGAATLHGTAYVVGGEPGASVEEVAWAGAESAWRVEPEPGFHLGWYSETAPPAGAVPLQSVGEPAPGIDLADLRDRGFPLPTREPATRWAFTMQAFRYPDFLDPFVSVGRILRPLLLEQTGEGVSVEALGRTRDAVLIKAGAIERADWPFGPQHPFPAPRLPREMVRIGAVKWSPQEWLDRGIVFSSLYVTDAYAFREEVLGLYRRTFTETTADTFLDDSDPTRQRIISVSGLASGNRGALVLIRADDLERTRAEWTRVRTHVLEVAQRR